MSKYKAVKKKTKRGTLNGKEMDYGKVEMGWDDSKKILTSRPETVRTCSGDAEICRRKQKRMTWSVVADVRVEHDERQKTV